MKLVKYIFWIAYNLWFYILVLFFTIVVVLPSFTFVLINNNWYKYHYKAGVLWADLILLFMGMFPVKNGALKTEKNKSYIFVANHVSMIDVMLLISVIRNNPLVFIGKKELEKIPVFGFIYKKTMILVDRSSRESKKKVFEETRKKIFSGISLGIFPEGTIPESNVVLAPFKHGAFTMAIEHNVPIVPITFLDNKRKFPWSYGSLIGFSKGSPGRLRVNIHDPISTEGLSKEDRIQLSGKVRDLILKDLSLS